jgi:hypothetical protein
MMILLSLRICWEFKNILELSMIYIYRSSRYPGIGGGRDGQGRSTLYSQEAAADRCLPGIFTPVR